MASPSSTSGMPPGPGQRTGHQAEADQQQPGEADRRPGRCGAGAGSAGSGVARPSGPRPARSGRGGGASPRLLVRRAADAGDSGQARAGPRRGSGSAGAAVTGEVGIRGVARTTVVPRMTGSETGAAAHIAAAPVLDAGRHGHNSRGRGQGLEVAPVTGAGASRNPAVRWSTGCHNDARDHHPVHPVLGRVRPRRQQRGDVPADEDGCRGLPGAHRALLQPHRVRRVARTRCWPPPTWPR